MDKSMVFLSFVYRCEEIYPAHFCWNIRDKDGETISVGARELKRRDMPRYSRIFANLSNSGKYTTKFFVSDASAIVDWLKK